MKIVHAQYHAASATVPVRGGFHIQFENSRAVVPDDVAVALIGMGGGYYSIVAEDLSFVKEGDRVLLVRDCGLGDVLMLTPMIRRLHEDLGIVVDVLTLQRYRCLFDGNPHVNATFALEDAPPDTSGYAYVLDLRLVVENAEFAGIHRHRADAFADYADVALHGEDDRKLDYFVSPEEKANPVIDGVRALASETQEEIDSYAMRTAGFIAYVLRASTGEGGNRSWSKQTHAEVIGELAAAGYYVVLLDNEAQDLAAFGLETAGRVIDLTGKLNLRQVGELIDACDAVIAPDTGLFHLAGALNKPTVTYFGPFPVEERHAHRFLNVVNDAKGMCPLAPCRSYSCLRRDEQGQARCLSASPVRVLDAVRGLIDQVQAKQSTQTKEESDVVATGLGRSSPQTDTPPPGRSGNQAGNPGEGQGPGSPADDLGATAAGDG